MKKVVLMAAVVLLALGTTSCKKGKCACVGLKTSSSTSMDIQEVREESGKDDADVCDEIKSNYPSAYAIHCEEGDGIDEAKAKWGYK